MNSVSLPRISIFAISTLMTPSRKGISKSLWRQAARNTGTGGRYSPVSKAMRESLLPSQKRRTRIQQLKTKARRNNSVPMHGMGTRRIARRWLSNRAAFKMHSLALSLRSAHRYKLKPDVVFRLRGCFDWATSGCRVPFALRGLPTARCTSINCFRCLGVLTSSLQAVEPSRPVLATPLIRPLFRSRLAYTAAQR